MLEVQAVRQLRKSRGERGTTVLGVEQAGIARTDGARDLESTLIWPELAQFDSVSGYPSGVERPKGASPRPLSQLSMGRVLLIGLPS